MKTKPITTKKKRVFAKPKKGKDITLNVRLSEQQVADMTAVFGADHGTRSKVVRNTVDVAIALARKLGPYEAELKRVSIKLGKHYPTEIAEIYAELAFVGFEKIKAQK